MKSKIYDVAVIGCGSAGLATAYYLARHHGVSRIALIDSGQPMALTSAQSGENYRNWWPHPAMVDFTNRSIDLLEDIARNTDNRISMTRRGYLLATRQNDADGLLAQLYDGLDDKARGLVRCHEAATAPNYRRPETPDWRDAPDGVDVLRNRQLIRAAFPYYADDIQTLVHIRRGGDISGQQLGMIMLEYLKETGARRISGAVVGIRPGDVFALELRGSDGAVRIGADRIVNAAGPFANDVAALLGSSLPVYNTLQQKIAFEDRRRTIPRDMPFSIDLDAQYIDWSEDEREALREDPGYRWLTERMPGSIHCRPDGGERGSWVKLGWAYNRRPAEARRDPPLDDGFPETVLRGAARLNPALKCYYQTLPRPLHHYGGWYTMTDENWPLIGPAETDGAFINCALSGFGTMTACAGGELCAAWVAGAELPSYALGFSLKRYDDEPLMQQLRSYDKGIL